jgi:thioredoxin:protein disulfide reductase
MNDPHQIERASMRCRVLEPKGSALMHQLWIVLNVCLVGLATASAASAPTSSNAGTTSIAGALGASSSGGQSSAARSAGSPMGLLDPMEAFKPQVRQTGPSSFEVKFTIAPRYYLYRERLGLELIVESVKPRTNKPVGNESSADGKIAVAERKAPGRSADTHKLQMTMPVGKLIDDPTFGRVEVYEQNLLATAVINPDKSHRGAIKLAVMSQGCAAEGVCFPPQRFEFSLPTWRPGTNPKASAETWISPSKADTLGFGRRSASPR